jgi:hypothetical protein
LVEAELELQLVSQPPAVGLDIGQGLVAVDVGLALAKQVEVWAVENENQAAHVLPFADVTVWAKHDAPNATLKALRSDSRRRPLEGDGRTG